MFNKDYAPIIIPTLNRFEHLKRLIDSLQINTLAKESELVIGVDYPPSENYKEGWEKIKQYVYSIRGFGKLTILEATSNLGANGNFERLRQYIQDEGYDSYIFSEDDNVFSPAFLSYMNWGLRTFKSDPTVLVICGFRRGIPLSIYKNNFYKSQYHRPYGFAIWIDKDERRRSRMTEDYFRKDVDSIPLSAIFNKKMLNRASTELLFLKKHIVHGDFCTNRMLEDEDLFCIVPVKPLVKNLGSDGSGIHGTNQAVYKSELNKVLDDSLAFVPMIVEPQLRTDETINADLAEKQDNPLTVRQALSVRIKYLYKIMKFLIYKTSGRIISYKHY